MQSRQLKHNAPPVHSEREAGDGAGNQGRRAKAHERALTRIDWLMIVSIVVLGLLMGYLAYTGWLPSVFG